MRARRLMPARKTSPVTCRSAWISPPHRSVGLLGAFARPGGMRANSRAVTVPARSDTRMPRGVRSIQPVGGTQLSQAPSFTREDLLTADDIAGILRIRRSTALDYMRRGVIPAHKIGRRWYALRSQIDVYIGELFEQR